MLIAARNGMMTGKSILPPGARWVEYLESTGTQYIVTDYVPSDNSIVELDFQRVDNNPSLMGVYDGSSRFNLGVATGTLIWFAGIGSSNQTATPISDTNRHILKLSAPDKKFSVSDVGEYACGTGSISGNTHKFNLFARYNNGDGGNCYPARLYGVKFVEGLATVGNLRPIAIGNTGYMLDLVSGEYLPYGNKGTGDFVIGPDK